MPTSYDFNHRIKYLKAHWVSREGHSIDFHFFSRLTSCCICHSCSPVYPPSIVEVELDWREDLWDTGYLARLIIKRKFILSYQIQFTNDTKIHYLITQIDFVQYTYLCHCCISKLLVYLLSAGVAIGYCQLVSHLIFRLLFMYFNSLHALRFSVGCWGMSFIGISLITCQTWDANPLDDHGVY